MEGKQIRVGIIGVHPDLGWAAYAHLPALAQLPEYRVTALSHHQLETAQAAARKFGIAHAVSTTAELVNHPDVDLVVVAVKVPRHRELIEAALNAGKAVLSEWPLALDLAEAIAMRDLAQTKGLHTAIGLQTRSAPAIQFVRDRVAAGQVGRVISSTLIGSGIIWGNSVPQAHAHTLDPASGANMISVTLGHSLDAVLYALGGRFDDLVAKTATVRKTTRIEETGIDVPMTVPDQVAVAGLLDNGVFVNVHFRGGLSAASNFHWEINGDAGDIVVTTPIGYTGVGGFRVQAAKHGEALCDLAIPSGYSHGFEEGLTQSIAIAYRRLASDLREGTRLAPTFGDAVQLHRLVERILDAGETGQQSDESCSHLSAATSS
jgi:predicted dehydrogenase